ncbi:trypsin-like peptidase domain-containing protein [Sphaerisporangium sp. TRM90804]|uniref:S1C family serine protease n=1 Tax=Sphaerisporangium sp. TRM90804 TaxID=3031113 RepID=UPI00244D15D6|nr:trypsin-like peptidase domain-containing protein [Sphaerisporangium sp. TRM90804]MDH2427893.1 trypsin-like peptidase domain-containing protein [Sphaerisporangium sp. TRM90804]
MLAAGVAAVLVTSGGCAPAASPAATGSQPSGGDTGTPAPPPPPPPVTTVAEEQAYERVITQVLPSIVQINTAGGLGSGVVYDTRGHILTNAHVVGKATSFEVTLATGGKPRQAKLVASYPLGDLAVIRVSDTNGLNPATFGDSGKLKVGQIVLAMGNPLGLSGSVTNGIISALGRTVTEPQGEGSPGATITNAIQTSAAINPGNSGGALTNMTGEVIGVPTLAAINPDLGGGAAPGIGFAIPSTTAKDVADQIIKYGKVTNSRRAALGVRVNTVVAPDGRPVGVGVAMVEPGGGAAKAGIKAGDVILSVEGKPTPTAAALSEVLATLKPGRQVKVELLSPDGRTRTVAVTLGTLASG